MLLSSLLPNPFSVSVSVSSFPLSNFRWVRFRSRAFLNQSSTTTTVTHDDDKSSLHRDSLRLLQWDQLCDSVASFAQTSFGREGTKAQLWSLDKTYEDTMRLLEETNAAVAMHNQGDCTMSFSGIDLLLVKSGIQTARRRLAVSGNEAMAIAALLQCADSLQSNLKAVIKKDADWYGRFMPLSEVIGELVISRSLMKLIQQLIDEDGSIRDSASSAVKQSRERLRRLEFKISQLMDSLVRNETDEESSLGVTNINGRWCINYGGNQPTSFQGLLLSSGSGTNSLLEPVSVVPLNDELQQARALVAQAEHEVLLMVTQKMQMDLDDIEMLLKHIIQLDIVNARATYGLSFEGTRPIIFPPESLTAETHLSGDQSLEASYSINSEWILYLPKTYHPLLLQKHKKNLRQVKKELRDATADIRRRKYQGEVMPQSEEADVTLMSLEMQVNALEKAPPVPHDFFISRQTRVLVITGPNTGGKTVCLKTVGLAAMMAKSGLYVLASEPAQIPWFDSVFADIGDEQSLSQSLSTFSGHLKQISGIRSQSTSQSLVLLDEVGAGTNPLEGAALGMALLESFADSGALLTISTTHHGELKALKYSNDGFENACMEFDETNLKPTYKILWGIPGRSNAISIAERLGLPSTIIDSSRKLYGTASTEINEVIISMERLKQDFQQRLHESRHYLALSRNLHEKLLVARRKIIEHSTAQRHRKVRAISEVARMARSNLHKKLHEHRRTSLERTSIPTAPGRSQRTAYQTQHKLGINNKLSSVGNSHPTTANTLASSAAAAKQSPVPTVEVMKHSATEKSTRLPKVGDMVHISFLGVKGTVLKVEPSKDKIEVQLGNMNLKLKLKDIKI